MELYNIQLLCCSKTDKLCNVEHNVTRKYAIYEINEKKKVCIYYRAGPDLISH